MTTPCANGSGCAQETATSVSNIPYFQMTEYLPSTKTNSSIPPVPGTVNLPSGSGVSAATIPSGNSTINTSTGSPAATSSSLAGTPAGNLPSQEAVFKNAPLFSVPTNPLLPPGYQEVLDYGNLQYLNGFLRTQIGKYVRVQQLVGSSVIEERYGYLVGVGINYILLQEISTGNILALDFYNIKYVYFYYTKPDLPQNEIR